MRAARFYAREDVRVNDVAEPVVGPGQVKVRPAFAGICGSDLHLYHAPEALGVDGVTPHPMTGALPPQIMGHEFSGTVEEIGEEVTGVQVGSRVAVFPVVSCGDCVACTSGRPNVCRTVAFIGLNAPGGGMADKVVVQADRLHVLPVNVDLRMGALVEPMAVGWHAVTLSGVREGGTALIAGAGPIGIGLWFALRARGVDRVLVSEPSQTRREVLAGFGAEVVDPTAENLSDRVTTWSSGSGVDAAFDAAGGGPAFMGALSALTPGGRVVVVAAHEHGLDFNPTALVMREVGVLGSLAYLPEDFDAVISAMAQGSYDPAGWVQQRPLEDVVTALGDLRAARAQKILLEI